MKNYSVAYCEMQLRRALQARERALRVGTDADYERTGDQIAKWEVNLRIARGASEQSALDAVCGPTRRS